MLLADSWSVTDPTKVSFSYIGRSTQATTNAHTIPSVTESVVSMIASSSWEKKKKARINFWIHTVQKSTNLI